MNEVNISVINKRRVEVLYFLEVLLPHLLATIFEAEKQFNILIELFHVQFFGELHKKLQKKVEIFEFYLEDLLEIKKEFDLHVKSSEKLSLDDKENEYEALLIQATADVSMLVKRLKIEIKEILEKKEKNNEDNSKNNNHNMLNY